MNEAKYYSYHVFSRIPDRIRGILKVYGYSNEDPLERILGEGRLYQLLEASPNIIKRSSTPMIWNIERRSESIFMKGFSISQVLVPAA